MTHTIYAVTLMLFATTHYANAAQKPITKALTDEERKKCEADAEKFGQLAAGMGGKFIEKHTHQEQKPKITDKPTKTDVRARL